jgi:hypothetical protein
MLLSPCRNVIGTPGTDGRGRHLFARTPDLRIRAVVEMNNGMYLRRQAEVLLNLSRATIDLVIAARLRALAAEFQARADEQEEERFTPVLFQRATPSSGEMDRD